MYIKDERYDELVQGIVGYEMLKDIFENKELTDSEKIYEMKFAVEVIEKNFRRIKNDNNKCN